MSKRIAVAGGGILGLTAALLAAERGYAVTLYERETRLFSRASAGNEGKVHLGLVYALSEAPTLTVMLDGALSFCQVVERACGRALPWSDLAADPFDYLVMPDSLLDADALSRFYATANERFLQHPDRRSLYFGDRLDRLVDPVPTVDAHTGLPAFRTGERAVNPRLLGELLVSAVERHPGVELRLGSPVTELDDSGQRIEVSSPGSPSEGFDAVLNCAWEQQQALLPLSARRPVSYRVKTAVRLNRVGRQDGRTVTLVIGPYGDVVSHADHLYVSWYPVGRLSRVLAELAGDDPLPRLSSEQQSELCERQLGALHALGLVGDSDLASAGVAELVGGFIVASGSTDIDDRVSGLHQRDDFGTHVTGRILTPRNLKLSTAPLAALNAVDALERVL